MRPRNRHFFSCTPGCCSFRVWILALGSLAMICLITFLSLGAIRAAGNGKTIALNVLSAKEKAAGWKLLFDGKTTSGWRGFRKSNFPTECWAITDGILKRVKQKNPDAEECGDIVTAQQY